MSTKTYYSMTVSVFFLLALLHLPRIAFGWSAIINGVTIPLWVSWFGVALAGYLSYRGFTGKERLSR